MFSLRFEPSTIAVPHLITIPYSHFCEMARWAMDSANQDYVEIGYALACHMEPVGLLRRDLRHRSVTSYPGAEAGRSEERREYSVPLVCLPGGEILRDSWEILSHYVGDVELDWHTEFDAVLGPAARRILYREVLNAERPDLMDALLAAITPEEQAFWQSGRAQIIEIMQKMMNLGAEHAEHDKEIVELVFQKASEKIESDPELSGPSKSISPWSIALSSLGGLLVAAPQYGASACKLPTLGEFNSDYQDWVLQLRKAPAGAFILSYYADHR